MRARRTTPRAIAAVAVSGLLVCALQVLSSAQANAVDSADAAVATYSTAELQSIKNQLDRSDARISGTAWYVDASTNQVSVETYGLSDSDFARLKAVTDQFGDAVRVARLSGTITDTVGTYGGNGIQNHSQSLTCTLGFNVRQPFGTSRFFITAGHCTKDTEYWFKGATGDYLGRRLYSVHAGRDYGIVEYKNDAVTPYGAVLHLDGTRQITTSRYAVAEETAYRIGAISSDYVGKVINPYTTMTSGGVTRTNMILATHCAKEGDSGGPLASGSTALGILSGSRTLADGGCRSWYTHVQEVLDIYGMEVY